MNRKLITVLDVFVFCVIIFICLVVMGFYLKSERGYCAEVSVDGKIIERLDLNVDTTKTIKTEFGYNIIQITNGECSVTTADCRDNICVKRGSICNQGDSIVCLPHKLIVEIK